MNQRKTEPTYLKCSTELKEISSPRSTTRRMPFWICHLFIWRPFVWRYYTKMYCKYLSHRFVTKVVEYGQLCMVPCNIRTHSSSFVWKLLLYKSWMYHLLTKRKHVLVSVLMTTYKRDTSWNGEIIRVMLMLLLVLLASFVQNISWIGPAVSIEYGHRLVFVKVESIHLPLLVELSKRYSKSAIRAQSLCTAFYIHNGSWFRLTLT